MKHGIRRMAVAGVLVAGLVGTIAPTAFALAQYALMKFQRAVYCPLIQPSFG